MVVVISVSDVSRAVGETSAAMQRVMAVEQVMSEVHVRLVTSKAPYLRTLRSWSRLLQAPLCRLRYVT